jgi:hypothetical protein
LNELGILSQIDVISSVSGGSILLPTWPNESRSGQSQGPSWQIGTKL